MNRIMELDEIVPCDMHEQARGKPGWECYKTTSPDESPEAVWILFYPDARRAAVCWGADSDWTDAENPESAYERYFGQFGREMTG